MSDNHSTATPSWINREDGHRIAYHASEGRSALPGVMFLAGYRSDMYGGKAEYLAEMCRQTDRNFVRFDYFGHGLSDGAFEDGTIGRWADDAVAVLDRVAKGPQILVGSSMGGWIMLHVALRRPERVAALVGIAAAPDFTEDLMWAVATEEQRADFRDKGFVTVPSQYSDEPTVITARLIEDGRERLLLRDEIAIDCPVRLLHGQLDPDVPWQTALKLADKLAGDDVVVSLVKDAEHRLARPEDLARLRAAVQDATRAASAKAAG